MRILVDTSVWSIALRRRTSDLDDGQAQLSASLAELVANDRVVMVGPIRQELLSGLREPAQFDALRLRLRAFDDEPLTEDDFEAAAAAHNACRSAGVSGSATDFLLCAVALRRALAVFTTDRDFDRYAAVLGLKLYTA